MVMKAEEWLDARFPIDVGENGEAVFCPMPGYMASLQFFVDTFGPTLEDALAAGKRGHELYDALMTTPGGTRGWDTYFRYWMDQGIFE